MLRRAVGVVLLLAALLPAGAHAYSRNWLAFFSDNSAELEPRAQAMLREAAAHYLERRWPTEQDLRFQVDLLVPGEDIVLLIQAHSHDNAPDQCALARRRGIAVRSLLILLGLPAERMTVQVWGDRRPMVPVPRGVRELQNRRVEVVFVRRSSALWSQALPGGGLAPTPVCP